MEKSPEGGSDKIINNEHSLKTSQEGQSTGDSSIEKKLSDL